jgi:hypothetical protein
MPIPHLKKVVLPTKKPDADPIPTSAKNNSNPIP